MENEKVGHKGVITQLIGKNAIEVSISTESCSGCSLGKWCKTSKPEGDKIIVPVEDNGHFCVGESVTITARQELEIKAIVVCLVVPLILLIAGVVLGTIIVNQIIGCLFGLVLVAIYFTMFYFTQKANYYHVNFNIEKNSDNE